MASARKQLENSDNNQNEDALNDLQVETDKDEVFDTTSDNCQMDYSSLPSKRNYMTIATQTPLILTKVMMIKPSVDNDQPTCSTSRSSDPMNAGNDVTFSRSSLPISQQKSSNASSLIRDELANNSKANFTTYRVKEMSVKLSREASTQATPPYPLLSTKSFPASRDVLQLSTSISSASSGQKSEILTVTTDYTNGTPDARSILVDVVDQNTFPGFSKSLPANGNRALQLSVQEAFSVPPRVQVMPRNTRNENRPVRIFRWRLQKCLKCTSPEEEREQNDFGHLEDAPPTYSSIFAEGTSSTNQCPPTLVRDRSSPFTAPVPPPSYAQAQGISLAPYSMDQLISVAPTVGGIWSNRPTAAICPRCTALVFTIVEVRQSAITHIATLLLCLFGCWPCCILPYCVNACRITKHYCPICRTYLGTYSPC